MLQYGAPLVEGDQVGRDSSAGIEGACVSSEKDTWYKLISSTDDLKDGLLEGCVIILVMALTMEHWKIQVENHLQLLENESMDGKSLE